MIFFAVMLEGERSFTETEACIELKSFSIFCTSSGNSVIKCTSRNSTIQILDLMGENDGNSKKQNRLQAQSKMHSWSEKLFAADQSFRDRKSVPLFWNVHLRYKCSRKMLSFAYCPSQPFTRQ